MRDGGRPACFSGGGVCCTLAGAFLQVQALFYSIYHVFCASSGCICLACFVSYTRGDDFLIKSVPRSPPPVVAAFTKGWDMTLVMLAVTPFLAGMG